MATVKKIKQGDVGNKLSFTITTQAGTAWDLSGAGTTVSLILSGGNTTVKATKSCANLTASGTCDYTFVAGDWTGDTALVPGKYKLECVIDTGTVEITTIDQGDLEILEAL
jgi:hypothetical protein